MGETQLDAALQGEVEGGLEHADFGSGHLYEFALGKLAAAVAEGDAGEIYFRVQAPHGFGRAVQVVLLAGAQYHLAR
ncbi:hypothetical protein SAMN00790413_01548 [Deinococcus hopiensis KR-140]|uniref:Uncharacterized protein n=1 Tax=Deinococcus hopiensis KR-140 TaxID=695939 RepID=A0A1W1VGN9_9DEIO|nr:hypothetical protein SAMN00790413_01548 [Deinococcus hopiensis KR-140]